MKLSKKTKGTIFLYGYLFLIFALGYAAGAVVTYQYNPVEVQEVQEVEKAQETPTPTAKATPTPTPTATPTPTPNTYKQIKVVATAYCPCSKCCGKSDGITATGTKATAGRTIAVDPSVIPYGSEVIINGHTYVAEDTGGAIKGNRIDIYFATHEDAKSFGRQTLTAKIKA